MFCGIETPDPDALKAMHKDHNMMVPILEGIHTINSYGMEVVSGIIMGLDTDKPETADALLAFVDESRIPLLTINLLQALPKTPLWDRLQKEGRLLEEDESRDSNVDFLLPYDEVVSSWRKCMEVAYEPAQLFARYQYQCEYTYANRIKVPVTPGDEELGQYPARPDHAAQHLLESRRARRLPEACSGSSRCGRLRQGDIEGLIGSAMIAHHLIVFSRAASGGQQSASNYSIRLREASVPAE